MMQRLPSEFARGNGAGLRLKARPYPATAVTGLYKRRLANLVRPSPPEVRLEEVT